MGCGDVQRVEELAEGVCLSAWGQRFAAYQRWGVAVAGEVDENHAVVVGQ